MNNSDFRALLGSDPKRTASSASPNGTSHKPSSTNASALGSRSRAFVPMTPRAIAGSSYQADFARQLAERNAAAKGSSNTKKARGPAVPKGTQLAAGYTDRAATRAAEEEDEKAARIKALEEQMKLGQIEVDVFEKMRDQITGGDIGATHLVKGLDRQLLERIRRGEDVLSGGAEKGEDESATKNEQKEEDVDDAFEQLEEKEIAPIVHEQVVKKGEMAPPPPVAGVKRSRNDILAELKAERKAAQEAAAAESQLGNRFKKIGDKKSKEPRIERDEKGREVLITVDEYGRVKRKVRKVAEEPAPKPRSAATTTETRPSSLLMPDKALKPLGMEVPDVPMKTLPTEDEDDDIFAGAGVAYNPLGDVPDDSGSSSDEEDGEQTSTTKPAPPPASIPAAPQEPELRDDEDESHLSDGEDPAQTSAPTASPLPAPQSQKQNYFNDKPSTTAPEPTQPSQDPILLGAIKRAAAMSANESTNPASEATSAAAKRLLARDRDMDDLDMGFGSSRFGDEEDDEEGGSKMKLSEWKGGVGGGDDDEEGEERSRGGGKQRKRGKKKRKGDKDSAADVMRVLEGRRKAG